jgi:hypothetical protein
VSGIHVYHPRPGVTAISVRGWRPAKLNDLLGNWRKAARLKAADQDVIRAAVLSAGLPPAKCKRRVSLTITRGPRTRKCDPDAFWKSLLDALVGNKLLVGDSDKWCELGEADQEQKGKETSTTIILEELDL